MSYDYAIWTRERRTSPIRKMMMRASVRRRAMKRRRSCSLRIARVKSHILLESGFLEKTPSEDSYNIPKIVT
uniref:Uncharacterized protein n=1 Tax=Arundo donax TaxID=35708 RepID=A0A0A8YLA9_ARUDO